VAADYIEDLSNNNGLGAAAALDDPHCLGGYGKGTEGLSFRDPDYHAFYDEAVKRRKPFGPYVFFHPGSDPRLQARELLAWTKPKPGDFEPVVDSETTDGLSMQKVAVATFEALDELRLHGFAPLNYGSAWWLKTTAGYEPRLKQFRVWQAEYSRVLHRIPGLRALLWQFTDRLVVAKGRLRVDGDRLLVRDVSALRIPKHAKVVHPEPPKKPPAKPAAKKPVVYHTTTTSGTASNVTYTLFNPVEPKPPVAKKKAAPKPKPKPAPKPAPKKKAAPKPKPQPKPKPKRKAA
jgi:hypothetical protein